MNIPAATYRLQFHAGWTLRQATDLVPYLHELGISHVYASPLLQARAGSNHGYDVCDPGRLNGEIGTEADVEAFVTALHRKGMGLILDIVPNHLAAVPENPRWRDVLKFGRRSRFADWFDIDWESPTPPFHGKLLLPVLATDLPTAVKRGNVFATDVDGEPVIGYFENRFPISPDSPTLSNSKWEETSRKLNSDPQLLLALLDEQHYRLSHWREADGSINYRRFFTVNELAGVRVELPEVFDDLHAHVLGWHRRGFIDGFRIDHPDGLADPLGYLQRLRAAASDAWVVIEKILEPGERIPPNWPIAGTTGYDFAERVSGLFIDTDSEKALTDFYAAFTGEPVDYAALAREKKRGILQTSLSAEVVRLTRLLASILRSSNRDMPSDSSSLKAALIELIACFPVYRTYVCDGMALCLADRRWFEQALTDARASSGAASFRALDLIADLFLKAPTREGEANLVLEFRRRFQQLTSAAMAKGVEDTTFYCFNRFIARNEVGTSPDRVGVTVEEFHQACALSVAQWPHTMLSTSTHDTKRSEDVRARLAVLSEIPQQWTETVQRWSALAGRHRQASWPDRNAEYHYYQTLVGAWPLEIDRAVDYMTKAAREAKVHTSWIEPSETYESTLIRFVRGTLGDRAFVDDVSRFVESILPAGRLNSLAQTLLKLTSPGVPDIYQGTELWEHSLVDPDNRRPVDFTRRRSALLEFMKRAPGTLASATSRLLETGDGEIKLYLIHRTLSFRRSHTNLFSHGTYEPLLVEGERAKHTCAFARTFNDTAAIVIVPRLVHSVTGPSGLPVGKDAWGDTRLIVPEALGERGFHNLYTGEVHLGQNEASGQRLMLKDILNSFPLALLELQ
jgi:(1->4)-alpha-D-glucan 1-alpha-D-glucosylmutase